jgi:hypothetical protein
MINDTLLDTIQSLERRAERLEKEAAALRHELTRVARDLSDPDAIVVTYSVGGERIDLTQRDISSVRNRMVLPHAEETIREVALAYKIAARTPVDDPDIEAERIMATIDAARAAAIEDGSAIDDESEAALDD